jgi:hypothetical protein
VSHIPALREIAVRDAVCDDQADELEPRAFRRWRAELQAVRFGALCRAWFRYRGVDTVEPTVPGGNGGVDMVDQKGNSSRAD